MARKSRKVLPLAVNEEQISAGWRAAIYVRLSVEDTRTRTDSIETQQMIIQEFLEDNREISVFDTYIERYPLSLIQMHPKPILGCIFLREGCI